MSGILVRAVLFCVLTVAAAVLLALPYLPVEAAGGAGPIVAATASTPTPNATAQ